jgi:signal transduction histidine kinase
VRAVEGALEQVLDGLLANALDVAPPGSEVSVRLARSGALVLVAVVDHGPGMPAEQRARAFDRFWRAPEAPAGGSGLGLAIVHHLAAASGGDAFLAETPGGGLTAGVRLPSAADDPRAFIPSPAR